MSGRPTLPDSTDVVVVGGGIMGAAAAYFLAADSDRDVTLVERDSIGSGSTGDSSAILRHHYGDDEIYTDMAHWSHEFFRAFEDETGQPIAYAGSPLVRFGEEGTEVGDYAAAGYDVLAERDIPVSWVEPEEFPEQYPMYDGLDDYDFAVSDDSAAYSDGTDAANGFARGAAEEGATVVTGVGVESIDTEDGAVAGVETENGYVECEDVVVAAGPWTPELAADVGVDVPITPTREQVVILDPSDDYVEEFPDLTPTTSMPGGEWYLRPDFGDNVLVATHYLTEETDPDSYDDTPDEETLLELTDLVTETMPGLEDAGIQGQYCGVYSTTPDHDFVIDDAGPVGCYLACGFSGHGFKHGPAVGRIVRDLVVDGDTGLVDVDYFALDRFEENPAGHGMPADNI
ncbi:FAD-dependent oxidoreductase [Halobacterium sp. R2-5]|uniref:NAD(P)/FAD-dependent oxidoreductase n=1 Tax=Halobacterium sp. R2-5 TaxID=2715751 RepID=UPI00141F61C3|nr:FAD-dependent oxidoreductase [Halobacterium sp. R2-5]NIC00795.1 FAD-binding oxidoreductase [Halobacterium sp. R2-5]